MIDLDSLNRYLSNMDLELLKSHKGDFLSPIEIVYDVESFTYPEISSYCLTIKNKRSNSFMNVKVDSNGKVLELYPHVSLYTSGFPNLDYYFNEIGFVVSQKLKKSDFVVPYTSLNLRDDTFMTSYDIYYSPFHSYAKIDGMTLLLLNRINIKTLIIDRVYFCIQSKEYTELKKYKNSLANLLNTIKADYVYLYYDVCYINDNINYCDLFKSKDPEKILCGWTAFNKEHTEILNKWFYNN